VSGPEEAKGRHGTAGKRFGKRIAMNHARDCFPFDSGALNEWDSPKEGAAGLKPLARFSVYMDAAINVLKRTNKKKYSG
jgi:hypothetical protein